jgi:hypothetical protein
MSPLHVEFGGVDGSIDVQNLQELLAQGHLAVNYSEASHTVQIIIPDHLLADFSAHG